MLRRLLGGRRLDGSAEQVLFALAANRALAPSSKLAAARWIREDVLIAGLDAPATMPATGPDWLLEIRDQLERKVLDSVADLLSLEVDLLFFDTTSTYFETEQADEPVARDESGNAVTSEDADSEVGGEQPARRISHLGQVRGPLSRPAPGHHRMAVTRDGIPVRVWCWPGNTADSALIRQVKDDMRDWCLSQIVWVADRGFTSAENRRYLRTGDGPLHRRGAYAPAPPRRTQACPGRAAIWTSPGTSEVKEVRSPRTSGSSSASTPRGPNAMPRSAPA